MKYIMFALIIAAFPALNVYYNSNVITGKVTDSNTGDPLTGVSVHWKGQSTGTTTDSAGTFSIAVSGKTKILVFSAVGYASREISISGNQQKLEITLTASSNRPEELVVSSYGIEKQLQGRAMGVNIKSKKNDHHQLQTGRIGNMPEPEFNTEDYDHITENRFLETTVNPLSTFSIDVDGASYSNVRRFLQGGQLPPAGAVRVEELINYFHYDYPQPKGEDPFSINTEIADCPWNKENKLVMIGLQGKKIPVENLPPGNIVFLIDVSGSMQHENKLPLVKSSIKLLIEQLREEDHVSMVVYAGNAGLVLPPTSGSNKQKIRNAVNELEAGGSTAGGAGIKLAYKIAK